MIDFPTTELLDERICTFGLERYLHPNGVRRAHYISPAGRLCRAQGYFPVCRSRPCHGYHTLLTGTVFAKTRQRPATLVLLLRGTAKSEPSARLAPALGVSRKQLYTLRHRIQTNLHETAPTAAMRGTAFESDELDQNAVEKQHAPSRSQRSTPPPGT
jgi:hypothetical protein